MLLFIQLRLGVRKNTERNLLIYSGPFIIRKEIKGGRTKKRKNKGHTNYFGGITSQSF